MDRKRKKSSSSEGESGKEGSFPKRVGSASPVRPARRVSAEMGRPVDARQQGRTRRHEEDERDKGGRDMGKETDREAGKGTQAGRERNRGGDRQRDAGRQREIQRRG